MNQNNVPPFYYYDSANDSHILIQCDFNSNDLMVSCLLPYDIEEGIYSIYYKEPCSGTKQSTGITATLQKTEIEIESITFDNGSLCAVPAPYVTISVTFSIEDFEPPKYLVIKK